MLLEAVQGREKRGCRGSRGRAGEGGEVRRPPEKEEGGTEDARRLGQQGQGRRRPRARRMDLPHRGDARIEDVPGGLRARLDIDPSISSCRRWRRGDPRFGYAQPARAACDSRIKRSNKRKPSSRRHPNAATRPRTGRRHADMRLITVLDVGNTSGGGKGCEGCDPTGHCKGGLGHYFPLDSSSVI